MAAKKPGRRGRPPHDDVLTPAEWRTAHAVKHGMSNREIALRRGVSADAIKFHVANALAKLGLSNRQQLRKWFSVPRDSALAGQGFDMQTPLRLGSIGQISRSVGDIARSETWYRSVLGLVHLYTFGTLAFFDCDGVRLMLSETTAELPGDSMLYLRVTEIVRAYSELQARGVEFTHAPHLVHRHADGTEEWMAFFKDPEGRPLAIMSQVKASP
jgi:DNA-binding CsgD family transcriptional regulator/catechol 2,3-dioxygenase-like lactoylglutathione lyase family enzyme